MWMLFQTFLLGFVVLTESKSFRSDYDYNEEIDGWFKLHRIPAIWHDAQLRCHLEGAVLASPVDTHMTNALKTYIRAKQVDECGIFTGVHATFSPGDFFSVEGVPLSSMPVEWMPEEPNNLENNEQCIAFVGNGTIADVDCIDVFPYVCFKKHTKAPVTSCGTIDTAKLAGTNEDVLFTIYDPAAGVKRFIVCRLFKLSLTYELAMAMCLEYVLNPKTGNCYKFHRNTRTWARAYMSCAAEGGYLAIPNSEEEAKFMKELFDKNAANKIVQVHEGIMRDIMHIGFHDWGERSDWRTIQGQTLEEAGFSRFSGGQPDNSTVGEFCGGMFRNGNLDDVWCHEVGPYMCEKSPDNLL